MTVNAVFLRSAVSFFEPGTIRKFTLTAFWRTLRIKPDSFSPGIAYHAERRKRYEQTARRRTRQENRPNAEQITNDCSRTSRKSIDCSLSQYRPQQGKTKYKPTAANAGHNKQTCKRRTMLLYALVTSHNRLQSFYSLL